MKYNLYNSAKTQIGESKISARGVFATGDIKKGELVEQCHFIIPTQDKGGADEELKRYMFSFINLEDEEDGSVQSFFLSILDDEEIKKSCEEDIKSLGYKSTNNLFTSAVVLGNGMIFNHSTKPNLGYNFNQLDFCFDFSALEDISENEELLIDYGFVELRKDIK